MARFKLVPYTVRVKQKQTDDALPLNDIDGEGNGFLKYLQKYLQETQETQVLEQPQKTISVDRFEVSQINVHGIVKSGEYGVAADFVDIETLKDIPHAREEKHSETLPFFFFFHIPDDTTRGTLILQMFKVHGIKTILEGTLNEYFSEYGLVVEFNRLISQALLEQLEKNRLVEFKLIRYDVPRNIADKVYNGSPEEIIEERVFRVKRNKDYNVPQWIKTLLSNKEIRYYEILGERYDEIKTVIEIDGSKRILTFGREDKFRESMPLDEGIPMVDGFPSHDHLLKEAEDYLKHLKENLGE